MGTTEDYLDKLLKGLTEDGISDEVSSNDDALNIENIIDSEHKEETIQTTYDYDNGASEAELEAMLDSIFGGSKDSQGEQQASVDESAIVDEPIFESNTISQTETDGVDEDSEENLFNSLLTGELLKNDMNSLSDELFMEKVEQDASDTEVIPAEAASDNSDDRFEELIKNRSQVHTDESAMDALLSGLNATMDEGSVFNNTEIGIPIESELNDEPVNNNIEYEEPEINMDEIRVVQTPLQEDFFQGEEPDPKVIEELKLDEFLAPREENIEIPKEEEISAVEDIPVVEEMPVVDEMPSLEGFDMPAEISDDMPVMDEIPTLEEIPAVDDMPTMEEIPVVDEMPSLDGFDMPAETSDDMPSLEGFEMPTEISDDMPVMDEIPTVEEIPAVDDMPTLGDIPAVEEIPVVDEMPSLEGFEMPAETSDDMPSLEGFEIPAEISDDMPIMDEIPTVEEIPVVEDIPVVEEIPVVDDMPSLEGFEMPAETSDEMPSLEGFEIPAEISDDMPIMDEIPTVEEIPAVDEIQAIEEIPAVEEIPVVDDMPSLEGFEMPAETSDDMPSLEGFEMPAEISDDMPVMDEIPTVEEIPVVEDIPVVEEIPVVDDMPSLEGFEMPAETSDEMPSLDGFDMPAEISDEMPSLEGFDIPAEISDEMPIMDEIPTVEEIPAVDIPDDISAVEEPKEESFDDIMKQALLELEPQSEQVEDAQSDENNEIQIDVPDETEPETEETVELESEKLAASIDETETEEIVENKNETESIEDLPEIPEEIATFDDMPSLDDLDISEDLSMEISDNDIADDSIETFDNDINDDSIEMSDNDINEEPAETLDIDLGEDSFGASDEIGGFDDMPSLDDLDMPEETFDNSSDDSSDNGMEDEDIGNLLKEIEEMGSGKDPLSYDIEEELEKASNVSDDDTLMADDMGLSELLSMGDDSDMAEISELLDKDENNELVDPSEMGLFDESQDFTSDDFDSENMFDGLPDDLSMDGGSGANYDDSLDEEGKTKEKKPGLFEKIKQFFKSFLVVPGEDDELEVFAEESAVDKAKEGAKENEKLLDEIDGKKKKKKKEKKEKKPKEKDPEKERKKKEKEAEKARKKAEKEAKKAAEKATPTKKLPMKKVIPIFILCISIGVATYLLSSVVPSAADKQKAEEQFKMQNYEEVYKLLRGHVLNEEEQLMFNKSVTIEKEIRKIDSFNNYMKLGMKSDALNSLVQAVKEYDNLSSKAEEYGVSKEVDMYYASVIKALNDNFAVSEEKAKEWAQISNREQYSRIIDRFIEQGPDFSDSEIGNATNAIIDSEEKEISALDYNSSMSVDSAFNDANTIISTEQTESNSNDTEQTESNIDAAEKDLENILENDSEKVDNSNNL